MKWQEVFKVHRKIGAVYFEENKLKSVLFSPDKRRKRHNFRQGDTIYLCFDHNSKSSEVGQILTLLKVGNSFTVYEKISPDCWLDAGLHECAAIKDGVDESGKKSLVIMINPV
ncbi:hypothetical protein [Geobacter sp.]|uniref:hypothetical protein n=1 Tax=Geobacter sp. TaxID=46610 RepID=UPI0027BA3577|nr:hypothetical protein [Geobacter sp.]